jgi:hypothetical protein
MIGAPAGIGRLLREVAGQASTNTHPLGQGWAEDFAGDARTAEKAASYPIPAPAHVKAGAESILTLTAGSLSRGARKGEALIKTT